MPVQIHEGQALRPGEEVEILRGRLAGFRGFVVSVNGKMRVRLSLASLGCFAEVEVSVRDVRVVG